MPVSWKTLFLPKNFPTSQVLRNYVFASNETHIGLVLDYGSLFNHHESANMKAVKVLGSNNVYFLVRMGFYCMNGNVLIICMHVHGHNRYTNTRTLSRPQKTSRLDRKFWFGIPVRIGLKVKMYRTPMLTTRAQCGGRTSTRSHVAKTFL